MAGTDCGFGTIISDTRVSEDVVWAKLEAMRDGAAIASKRLSGRGAHLLLLWTPRLTAGALGGLPASLRGDLGVHDGLDRLPSPGRSPHGFWPSRQDSRRVRRKPARRLGT